MTNFKNDNRFIVSTLTTVPAPVTQTGTITTLGQAVTGSGTTFTNNKVVQTGDWIWNGAYEIRKVIEIKSDTLLIIEEGFTVELAASALYTIKASRMSQFTYLNTSGSVATNGIDGVSVAVGESASWNKSGRTHSSSQNDFVDPVIVDGTTEPLTILTLR